MDYDGATCRGCGGAWFMLVPFADSEGTVVGICLDSDGSPSGWTGEFACMECDTVWQPRPQLRVVNG